MKQQSAGKQTPSSSGIPSNGSSATHLTGIATPQWRAPARGSRGEWARGSASPRPPPSELASVCRWSAALGAEPGAGDGCFLSRRRGKDRTHGERGFLFPDVWGPHVRSLYARLVACLHLAARELVGWWASFWRYTWGPLARARNPSVEIWARLVTYGGPNLDQNKYV